MKKFLQCITVLLIVLNENSFAQCDVQNPTTSDLRTTQNGANCEVLVDVIFDLQTNSGNKFTFFHVWAEGQFPQTIVNNVYGITCGVTNTQTPAKDPPTKTGGNAATMLTNAFINFGFNIDLVSSTPATTGIFTSYGPDNTVVLNYTSGDPSNPTLISKTTSPLGGGYVRVTIQNLKFTIPNYLCGSNLLAVKSFVWASNSNASNSKAQCYFCGNRQVYNDPAISGTVNCTNPRTYNVFIDSKYEDPIGTAAPITGTYKVFIDDNRNGLVDPIEESTLMVTNTTSFTTSTAGAPSGFTSRYAAFNQSYGVVLAPGDEKTTDPLIVRVTVTTAGYSGSIEGSLFNACATLPVSLKAFNATQRNGKASLTWETDMENNNDGFEIEKRSAGNSQFVKIGFVDSKAASGTGGAFSYSFDDLTVLAKGVTYYRLKQIDLDGRATYSDVKAVRTGNGILTISVYPNPSRGMVNVTIPESNNLMDVSVDDYTGKSIQRWSGIKVQNMQINNLKPGVYMLRFNFRESGETITQRIVVQ
ncbi:T9SS type A sorting domain-containing protein [Lacibacter luteus]|uniref:T9SS type A sorting domain-containing protein n=1 Tax=Lacibacter luteus TaxID=2508719 RepID=A0A4Q1CN41_9BACT|nr:T9SS type A sorting domain-containing protein [Lacibacter luteus]RXK62476.1 T9SS type A sorting domain-containing protein [Lacibacter luteus]